MEDINTRFILSTEERESCIVSVNLYQNKYWIITNYDTGKSIYELNCDEIVDCKIRKRAAMLSSEDKDKDEEIKSLQHEILLLIRLKKYKVLEVMMGKVHQFCGFD